MATDKARLKEITDTIKIHCNIAFDNNYYKTTKGLINKLKKNKEFSMDGGKIEGWIGGLLYVVGEDSGLFNINNWIKEKRYISKTDLAGGVGVSISTMRSRAKDIRDILPENSKFIADITYREDDYKENDNYSEETLESMADKVNSWSNKVKKKEEYEIYLLKARRARNYEEALRFIDTALIYAKDKIESEFENLKGHLWKEPKARPYMLIKEELAYVYSLGENYDHAIREYYDILELNIDDEQSIRHKLLVLLIKERRFDEANKLMKKYEEDTSTFMLYNRALCYFAKKEDNNAKLYINKAFAANMNVPIYLLGMNPVDNSLPDEYVCGSVEEAMYYFEEVADLWINEENSLYWLIDEYFDYLDEKDIKLGHSREDAKKAVEYALNMMNM